MDVAVQGATLLVVSTISVIVYMTSLGQLLINKPRPGLIRTAYCRLFAALLYVGVGLITLQTHQQGPLVGLGVLTIVQLMWQLNAIADVRLARRRDVVDTPATGRHSKMSDPYYPVPLPDAVVSAEIDRLSGQVTACNQAIGEIQDALAAGKKLKQWALPPLIFSLVVGGVSLTFGLILYNKADSTDVQAQHNSQLIQHNSQRIDQLQVSLHDTCSVYRMWIDSYSTLVAKNFPLGTEVYNDNMRSMIASAQRHQCGIPSPSGLGG